MEANFKQSLVWVRESEGGNDDDPVDRGGRTSRGITQRECDAYCQIIGHPLLDVWKAPDPLIDDIYHKSYWMPYGPILPPGVDYLFFDECVNAGVHTAKVMLQVGLGFHGNDVDAQIGVVTSAALSKADPVVLIHNMSSYRHDYYKWIERRRPSQVRFDPGWMARVAFAEKNALTLVPN